MTDRTHSHDTSTPAMSAETVPSEEFVLVPREPTPEMLNAAPASYSPSFKTIWPLVCGDIYRAMIAAAPTLSASHLAKEGGEAGAVEPIEKHRIANRLRGMFDMSMSSADDFNRLTPAGFRLLRQAHDALIAPDEAVAAPAPNPSPVAKGGDAVLEWETCTPLVGNCTEQAYTSFGYFRIERSAERDQFQLTGPGLDMRWGEGLESGKAAVEEYFVNILRGYASLLSTPTEGPASQTEGMGGDAVREALVEPLKWARTTDPSEGSVHYGTGVFGHWYAASRVKPKVWSVNHHIDGKNVIVGLFESLQSAYAAAQSDYDCRIRAALSTPTEGPASQTEGSDDQGRPWKDYETDTSELSPFMQRINEEMGR